MRKALLLLVVACALSSSATTSVSAAPKAKMTSSSKAPAGPLPWCAPEVSELSDHTCWFDGGTPADGRRTLVVYLHGAYAATPGFEYLQQRALALQAKHHNFTLLLPTAPRTEGGYLWPSGQAAQKATEAAILENVAKSKAELERLAGKPFDETFVVGFSSGAYYASSLAVRQAIDVDGFMVFAGGSSWARPSDAPPATARRAPVFVGVSAADRQTVAHSRAFAGTLAALGWPRRVEERNVGHTVDWVLFAHGLAWLRARTPVAANAVR